MKCYFIYTNDQQQGPFSIQELKDLAINQGTPVWKEGFDAWKKAGEIEALKSCFEAAPPPYSLNLPESKPVVSERKQISNAEHAGRKAGKLIVWAALIVAVAIVAGFIYNKTGTSTRSYLTVPALDPEKYNPSNYLDATGTYSQNFWGDKIKIEGAVKNSATHTNYKDVQITVYFYSRTKSLIQSQSFVLYDYFPYGMTKPFELKVNKPSGMATCGWEATNAIAY